MSEPIDRAAASATNRRVLLVSYYFPPSGGPGVQRTLKFAKYLPKFGWDPIVLTVDPRYASYPAVDADLDRDVPEETVVVRTKAWDPYSAYARLLGKRKEDAVSVGFLSEDKEDFRHRIGKWVRANLFVPDARVGWVPFAVKASRDIHGHSGFDAVVSTGPPHSTHLAGRRIATRYQVPWIADFRDPWTGIDFYSSLPMGPLARRRDKRLEQQVLADADIVVAVTPGMRRALSGPSRPVEVITNGYDPADFSNRPTGDPDFVLSYVGNMNESRNPTALWNVLSRLKKQNRLGTLAVRLVGPIDSSVRQAVADHGLGNVVSIEPPVSHTEAIQIMMRSAMLLLVVNNVSGAEGIMTGKIFEYVASGRIVLGLGPTEGDAAELLRSVGAGEMFDWADEAGIERFLLSSLDCDAGRIRVSGASEHDRTAYSREGQAGQLAGLLNRLVEK